MRNRNKVTVIDIPCPVVIIDDFYTAEQCELIMGELNFLRPDKLLPPAQSGSALDDDGQVMKNNKGIFLDELYTKREISDILTVNRKLYDPDLMQMLIEVHPMYELYRSATVDNTLISHYSDGDYYKPHRDTSSFTSLSWFFNKPKSFTGGDLYLSQYDITVECKYNRVMFMLSSTEHEVTKMEGSGRYCISNFAQVYSQ